MKIIHTKVSFKDGRYHRAIPGEAGKNIPHWLFDMIVILQTAIDDLHSQAKWYKEFPKEKPFTRVKNHRRFEDEVEPIVVKPGEIVTFKKDEADPSV